MYLCSMKVLTGKQFQQLDKYTIDHEPIQSIDLMERAAKALTAEIMRRWPSSQLFHVFAGPGNNGGDGLAVARMLGINGYSVKVWLFNVRDHLSPDCERNQQRLKSVAKVQLTEVTQTFDFPSLQPGDVIIDALFGTGLNSSLSGGFAQIVHKINDSRATVVSIDVPSGLMCEDNSYNDRSSIVRASLTLTIQLPKLAFLLAENESFVGEWKALDIQLSEEGLKLLPTPYSIMQKQDFRGSLIPRPKFAHKGMLGHALLAAGSLGMAGAAILAARACLRSGTGKLTVHTPNLNGPILQSTIPEAVLLLDRDDYALSECPDLYSFDAVGVGPGLGKDPLTAKALQQYLSISDSPMVIDADALNLLAENSEWFSQVPSNSILTPHPKEMDRLLGGCSNDYERLIQTTKMAIERQIFIILKGHYTAICTPMGRVTFCPRGNSGMATPGSGDVLTGIVTGVLAQGYPPAEASRLGVWLHATAGDLAARELEPECMMASDIVAHLPGAFRDIKETEQDKI